MLKTKNNFEIIISFFHCWAETFSEHPRILQQQWSNMRIRCWGSLRLPTNWVTHECNTLTALL